GVRFRQRRTADAVRLATEYSQRAPFDTLGWQLLASSHYLAGNTRRALGAWNRIGQPRIDLLRIDGSSHARFRELAASLDMPAGGLLTPKRYALARRRIADVPSLSRARVDYTIVDDGVAEVRAAVVERPVIAPLRQLLVRGAVDAAIRRDASLTLFSPLGFGESWSAQWRWQSADPRVAVRLSIPARIGIPTVVRLERSWETYRFSAGLAEEQRSVAAVNLAGWTHPLVDVLLGARLENWSDRGENIVASGGVGLHDTDDHVALLIEGERAVAREGGTPYDRLRWRGLWTPPADRWRNTWSLRIGTDWTSATTPLGLQPLAAGDLGRDIPLRAHPYIIDGALPSRRIARAITHGGVSADRAVGSRGPLTLAAGIFLDAAHLMSAADGLPRARTYLDAGAGVRIGTSASSWSAVRIDVARGLLSDRRWGISAGLAPQWPARLGRARDRR
ncbi:MAG TPA: hypothetical protein VE861_03945, partial [Gemmatimonadaceae bacterium]|nr:hypothetical protein [Gemmatimonadaceae bacterium]